MPAHANISFADPFRQIADFSRDRGRVGLPLRAIRSVYCTANPYARLQQTITVGGNIVQDKRDALDAGGMREVVVQVNVLSQAGAGSLLTIQHAAVREDNQFEDVQTTVSLAATGPKSIVVMGHTRYLRWKTTSLTGSATFLIDTIGRE